MLHLRYVAHNPESETRASVLNQESTSAPLRVHICHHIQSGMPTIRLYRYIILHKF